MSIAATRSFSRFAWRMRRTFWRRHDTLPTFELVDDTPVIVLPGVFNGALLRTGRFLVEPLARIALPANPRVLDLGTGSGIGAIFAAKRGARVIATDINPEAARCAQLNAIALRLEHQIETRIGDLFEPVRGERFDLILFNPPFYRGQPRNMADCAWRSPDMFDRFLRELPAHLTPPGRALVVLSTDGDLLAPLQAATHLTVRTLHRRELLNETLTVHEVRGGSSPTLAGRSLS